MRWIIPPRLVPESPQTEGVVSGRRQLHAHAQRAERAVLADQPFDGLGLRGRLVGNARRVAPPAQLLGRVKSVNRMAGFVAI